MNLHRILEIQKGLPPSDLRSLLFARKSAVNPVEFQTATAKGYPCILENSAGKSAVNYKIFGNSVRNGTPSPESPVETKSVGDIVIDGENSGKYAVPIVSAGADGTIKTTTVYLDEPLRKTGNYSDELTGNSITRKNIEIILDGSEVWNIEYENDNGLLNFKTVLDEYPHNADAYSNILPTQYTSISNTNDEGIYINRSNLFVRKWKTSTPDVETFCKWLSENPMTLQYILRNPVTENAIFPQISLSAGNSTVTADTEIPLSDMEITYKVRI